MTLKKTFVSKCSFFTVSSCLLVSGWASGGKKAAVRNSGRRGKYPVPNCTWKEQKCYRTQLNLQSAFDRKKKKKKKTFQKEKYFCTITFRSKTQRDITFKRLGQGIIMLRIIYNPRPTLHGSNSTHTQKHPKYIISKVLIKLSMSLEAQHSFIQNSILKVTLHIFALLL